MNGKKRKVAWGITGGGDKLKETFNALNGVREQYSSILEIEVFLSKAGELVLKYYKLEEELRKGFKRVWVEKDANRPFLAGRMQLGEFDFLLIAPATSNTVAKLSVGISDTMITNGAIQGLKAYMPLFVMPCDFREGTTVTKLPDGRDLRIRVRKEDVENVKRIAGMDGVHVFEKPDEIVKIFEKHFTSNGE